MKKIMILGGNPETAVLVNTSISMGFHTIVVDMDHGSPAKKNASESYDINVFDVNKMVELAKKLEVDAVLIGVVDVLVKPYKEICDKLNIPCYVTDKAVEQTRAVLDNPQLRQEMVDHDYELAKKYFSYSVLYQGLRNYMIEHGWLAPDTC